MQYHLVTTFLQTFILIAVGCLILFFKEDNFTDRVMVSVTTLLVEVTLMSSVQGCECVVRSMFQILALFLKTMKVILLLEIFLILSSFLLLPTT